MRDKQYIISRKIISVFLIIFLIVSSLLPTKLQASIEDNGYQIVVDSKGNQVIKLKVEPEKGLISIVGTHNYSGSTTAYLTVGYTLALNKNIASSSTSSVRTGRKNKDFIEVERENTGIADEIDGNTVTSYYQITIDNAFIQNLFTVWKANNNRASGDKVGSQSWYDYRQNLKEGMKVYMSYIFAVIHRNSSGTILNQSGSFSNASGASGTLYYTYQAIRDAVNWSERTKYEILPEYYDLEFTIRLNTYTPKIEFVDPNGNVLVANDEVYEKYPGKGNGYCLFGGNFIYYLPESAQSILINGKRYMASEEARYYRSNQAEESKLMSNVTGDLKGHLPYYRYSAKHDFNDESLLQIVFVPEETPIEVQAVDADTGQLIGEIPCDRTYTKLEEKIQLETLPEQMYDSLGQEYQLVWENATKDFPTWKMSYWKKGSSPGYYTPENQYGIGVKRQMSAYIANTLFDNAKPIRFTAYYQKTGNQGNDLPKPETGQGERKEERIEIIYTDPALSVHIGADSKENEKFEITSGIPVSESLYTFMLANEYLLKTSLIQVSGTKEFPVRVKRTYILKWTEVAPTSAPSEEEESVPAPPIYRSETVVVERTITIARDYSFTYIDGLAYYKLHSGAVKNAAFPGGTVTLNPKNYVPPSISYQSLGSDTDAHIILPNEVKNGSLDLGTKILDGGYSGRPAITEGDSALKSLADSKIGKLKCRNDYLSFDGKTVLTSALTEQAAPKPNLQAIPKPDIIKNDVLLKENIIIPEERENQSFTTEAVLRYTPVVAFGGMSIDETYEENEIKPVVVHTPVYCKGIIEGDNDTYVQLINPDLSCIQLVLDENSDLNDFWISISNYGFHSEQKGYETRDYGTYLALDKQGKKQNQVKFPFDVILDIGNNKDPKDDQILPKETWFTIGSQKQRIYLPMYIKEGIYQCEFRSLAANSYNRTEKIEQEKNSQRENYAAADKVSVQISGRLYGLTLYDISEDLGWKGVFREPVTQILKRNQMDYQELIMSELPSGVSDSVHFKEKALYDYTSGLKNSYGKITGRDPKFTLPLCEGSHPLYQNQGFYKNGYPLRFFLHTTGDVMSEQDSYVKITPNFFWVDENGKNREKVDVFYKEKIGGRTELLQIGSLEDLNNQKLQLVGGSDLGIPEEELRATAKAFQCNFDEWSTQKKELYSYGGIHAGLPFRTYSNLFYSEKLKPFDLKGDIIPSEEQLIKQRQSYYFTYQLPANLYIAPEGYDLKEYAQESGILYQEEFWKKDGYLLVNFQITAVNNQGQEYLDYGNFQNWEKYTHCCMWEMEGAQKKKELCKDQSISLEYGDVLILAVKKGAASDYQSGGIY